MGKKSAELLCVLVVVISMDARLCSQGISSNPPLPTSVPLSLLHNALSKSAVCLDGSAPGYHLLRGYGSGSTSWIIQLEGGGWCNDIKSCVFRKTTHRGSSLFMEKYINFTGILSDRSQENPDFFNWNKVKIRYCDGASFTGEAQNQEEKLYFRGERIWRGIIDELLSKGLSSSTQALLSGCSAGGLASILHCDQFKSLLPNTTSVKCLSDAGFFLDVLDVSGRDNIRNMYQGVVNLQGSEENLPRFCTDHLDPTSCFFPQNLISGIKTPLFILNSAYDSWQVKVSLVPSSADPGGLWDECKADHTKCNSSQIEFFQNFRSQMLKTLLDFGRSTVTGFFINSCFSHCHSENTELWFAEDSPRIQNKRVAEAVADWFFERENGSNHLIDCPYPCDRTCIHDM